MFVLGIESSCDETSIAVLKVTRAELNLKGFSLASQTKLHARWGGVVPELAARRHAETIIPLLDQTLHQAGLRPRALDLIAVTQGPGLITALQVGVETAKALSAAWRKPLVGVNHIAGHLVSPFLTQATWQLAQTKKLWPAVALVVSGGHTELYLMTSLNHWQCLGRTLDDAAGEAFDKVGKMLQLAYPGGPKVAALAKRGNPQALALPRPMLKSQNDNFSFAGLKTAVLYSLKPQAISHKRKAYSLKLKADVCASFQAAALDVLVAKTFGLAERAGARSVLVSGGVSGNQALRQACQRKADKLGLRLLFPDYRFTGDNAAMIALAGATTFRLKIPSLRAASWQRLQANANWELW